MNVQRRKKIAAIIEELQSLEGHIEEITSEEQDYFDAMPEGIQMSERGDKAEEAIQYLESARDAMGEVIGYLEEAAQ